MFNLIKRFVKKRLPDAVVTHEASLEPYLAPLGGRYNDAAAAAMRATFGKEPAFVREGGSIGAVLTMRKLLKAPGRCSWACRCPNTATTPSTRTSTGGRRAAAWRCFAVISTRSPT